MIKLNLKSRLAFFLLLIWVVPVHSQMTKIRGTITDANSKEPLPFVNVTIKNTQIGTVTNTEGEFFIETRSEVDSIYVSFVGYKSQAHIIQKFKYQEINFNLEQETFELDEIVIVPGENPAHPIFRNIIANKKRNNPDKLQSYTYELYNKIELDVNNVDDKFKNQRFLRDFQFIFDYVDTSAITGKTFLPFMISESLSDYYFQKSPKVEKEVIKASQISGVENESLAQFTGMMYQRINIYDNFIWIFEPGFISPISDLGLLYYKYYLQDSAFINNHWCYHLTFIPKRKQERVFRGDFWVADTTFAIKQIQMRLSTDADINYINDFVADYTYDIFNDSIWFLTEEKLFVDFNLRDRGTGFFGRKTTNYMNIKLNQDFPDEILDQNEYVALASQIIKNDRIYWDTIRPVELTSREQEIFSMVDSIKKVPIYNFYEDVVNMFVTYYYEVGPIEIGPYYKMYSFNEIEGNRFRLSLRTSNQLSEKYKINGHIAYGTKDKRFKYGGGLVYLFDNDPRMGFGISYKNDIEQLGQSPNALTEDNFFKSLLSRTPHYELTMVEDFNTHFEKEWFRGFSNKITFTHRRLHPSDSVPFQLTMPDNSLQYFNDIKTTEISLNTRIAIKEKVISGDFQRISLGTTKPIINLRFTAGIPGVFESEYEYYKIEARMDHKIPVSPFGYFRYIIDAGVIFGELPYPLLKLHEGNETYAFDRFAYNMMNHYEFVSDRYASIYAEQHFQGFFLNKVPLIKKLKLREVISAKCLIGDLSNKHQEIMDFPDGLHALSKPYAEASVGLENILKIFRVDAVWRLSYLDHPDIQKFGYRVKLQIVF